jgi:hypothetical protein
VPAKRLPQLIDVRTACDETGLPKSTVLRIMRRCDVIKPPNVRRVFVRRRDFERELGLDSPWLIRPDGSHQPPRTEE